MLSANPPLVIFLAVCLLVVVVPRAKCSITISTDNYLVYYSSNCNDVLPEAPVIASPSNFFPGTSGDGDTVLHFEVAHVTGGQGLLPSFPYADSTWEPPGIQLSFQPYKDSFLRTKADNVLNLRASLRLSAGWQTFQGRRLRKIRYRPPKIPIRSSLLNFELYGFWSESNGNLCMVGSGGSNSIAVVLKLKFPLNFTDYRSLITGKLENVKESNDSFHFEPVSILGRPHFGSYNYTLVNDVTSCLRSDFRKEENIHLNMKGPHSCISEVHKYAQFFKLEYAKECNAINTSKCNPLGENSRFLPEFMAIKGIGCKNSHAIRVLIIFSRLSHFPFGILQRAFDPNTMLVGEASWSDENEVLCVVACPVLNFKDSFSNATVGECSSKLVFRFPLFMTISNRYTVEGRISSQKASNEPGYFHDVLFKGFHRVLNELGVRYKYTHLEKVSGFCSAKKGALKRVRKYPDSQSKEMVFSLKAINRKGQVTHTGQFYPLFINDELYAPFQKKSTKSSLVNITYTLSFFPFGYLASSNFIPSNKSVDISAEGTYNTDTGTLCMLGCRHVELSLNSNASMDCEVFINVQFSPLNGNGKIKGTIRSTRKRSDPLFFDQFSVSSNSMYETQAKRSIWRMDMEITMALISNTLACLFLALQLLHIKRHPQTLPLVSIMMLIVLTLGYMVPLLLNFEALFASKSSRHLLNERWVEVNEVIMRMITMVAFLLQLRILHLAWSAKEQFKSERMVFFILFPVLICGALATQMKKPSWESLKWYGGLVVDLFLVPQIVSNVFSMAAERALCGAFYVGMTCVRVFPHGYDLYRGWSGDWSFVYANHRQGYLSGGWDVGICVSGLVFCVVVHFQQRLGGGCGLNKFRDYEKVPVISMEEMRT